MAGWYLLPCMTHVATAKGLHRTGGRTGGNTDVGLLDKGELAALRAQSGVNKWMRSSTPTCRALRKTKTRTPT